VAREIRRPFREPPRIGGSGAHAAPRVDVPGGTAGSARV